MFCMAVYENGKKKILSRSSLTRAARRCLLDKGILAARGSYPDIHTWFMLVEKV